MCSCSISMVELNDREDNIIEQCACLARVLAVDATRLERASKSSCGQCGPNVAHGWPRCRKPDEQKYNLIFQNTMDHRSYTERRFITNTSLYKTMSITKYMYSLLIFLSLLVIKCSAQSCDFTASGLDTPWSKAAPEGGGVQSAYLHCTSGRVVWKHPRGAVRLTLSLPHGTHADEDGEFRACLRLDKPIDDGGRIFVEGHRTLVPLYPHRAGGGISAPPEDPLGVRCFSSYKGRVALFLEATPNGGFREWQIAFSYHIEPVARDVILDPLQECRPCTDFELLRLYCSADFVARGFVVAAENDVFERETRMTVVTSKIFQQTSPIFSAKKSLKEEIMSEDSYWEGRNFVDGPSWAGHKGLKGHVYLPSACEARAGGGEFVVMGRMRLGQAMLKCAPRLEQWKNVVQEHKDSAQCVLDV